MPLKSRKGKGEFNYGERMKSACHYRKQIFLQNDNGQKRIEVYLGINKRWKTEIETQTQRNSIGLSILVKTKYVLFWF